MSRITNKPNSVNSFEGKNYNQFINYNTFYADLKKNRAPKKHILSALLILNLIIFAVFYNKNFFHFKDNMYLLADVFRSYFSYAAQPEAPQIVAADFKPAQPEAPQIVAADFKPAQPEAPQIVQVAFNNNRKEKEKPRYNDKKLISIIKKLNPSFGVGVYFHSNIKNKRFIYSNNHYYREGDKLNGNFEIVEIKKSEIVFLYMNNFEFETSLKSLR